MHAYDYGLVANLSPMMLVFHLRLQSMEVRFRKDARDALWREPQPDAASTSFGLRPPRPRVCLPLRSCLFLPRVVSCRRQRVTSAASRQQATQVKRRSRLAPGGRCMTGTLFQLTMDWDGWLNRWDD